MLLADGSGDLDTRYRMMRNSGTENQECARAHRCVCGCVGACARCPKLFCPDELRMMRVGWLLAEPPIHAYNLIGIKTAGRRNMKKNHPEDWA